MSLLFSKQKRFIPHSSYTISHLIYFNLLNNLGATQSFTQCCKWKTLQYNLLCVFVFIIWFFLFFGDSLNTLVEMVIKWLTSSGLGTFFTQSIQWVSSFFFFFIFVIFIIFIIIFFFFFNSFFETSSSGASSGCSTSTSSTG